MKIKDQELKYRAIGKDIALENTITDDGWAQLAATETAESIYSMMSVREKDFFSTQKIRDIKGWIGDEIYEGMRSVFECESTE